MSPENKHEDKMFAVTFAGVLGFLVALAIVFGVIAGQIGKTDNAVAEKQAYSEERAKDRIAPVGSVSVEGQEEPAAKMPEENSAQAPKDLSPEELVNANCLACHGVGVLGAPKIGTKEDWAPRMANGLDKLVANAINGVNAMPPRGGNASLSDDQIKQAVVFMLEKSGIAAK